MGKIKNIVAGVLVGASIIVPYLAKAQKPKKDVTISATQNNGYYFFLGPRAGGTIGTQATIEKDGFFVWGAYDHQNNQIQEIDAGYHTKLFSKESKNQKNSVSATAGVEYWMYPSGSVAGATSDFVLKPKITASGELVEGYKTNLSISGVHLIDNDQSKNGSAYKIELNQPLATEGLGLETNVNLSSTFGDGLYNFKGHLNLRYGIDISKTIDDFTLNVNITKQVSGNNQPLINDAVLTGITVTYKPSVNK